MPVDTSRPFRGSVARADGLSRRALAGSAFRRLFADVYVQSAVLPTTRIRAEAALLVMPTDSHVSHHTAALLWDAVVPPTAAVHVTTSGTPSRREGIKAHRRSPKADVVRWHGIPVSSPAQTFVELACHLSPVDLVVPGDSLVRAGRITPRLLVEASRTFTGRGAARARKAARWVRQGVDSPMESRLRMLIVLAGSPEPAVDYRVYDHDGRLLMRFDMCHPELKLIIEYDGRLHAESDQQWGRDLQRREDLDGRGWRIVVVRAADIYECPGRTLTRIVAALRDRGADGPLRLRSDWERHFAQRTFGPRSAS